MRKMELLKTGLLLAVLAAFLAVSPALAADLPKVETPMIATTCGQSPEAMMVKISSTRWFSAAPRSPTNSVRQRG